MLDFYEIKLSQCNCVGASRHDALRLYGYLQLAMHDHTFYTLRHKRTQKDEKKSELCTVGCRPLFHETRLKRRFGVVYSA